MAATPAGVKEYTPVFTSFAPVDPEQRVWWGTNEFLDWMLSASADVHTGPTGANLRRTIDVITLNEKGIRGDLDSAGSHAHRV